jgi:hypothetical protein
MLLKRIVIEVATTEQPQTDADLQEIQEELEDVLYSLEFRGIITNRIDDGHEKLLGKLAITVTGL